MEEEVRVLNDRLQVQDQLVYGGDVLVGDSDHCDVLWCSSAAWTNTAD